MRRLSMLADFAVRSLAMTVVFALLLAAVSAWLVRSALIEASNRAVRDPIAAAITATVPEARYAGVLDGGTRDRLDETLRSQFLGSDVVALKIYNRDGLIVYSTVEGLAGQRFDDDAEVREALAGRSAATVRADTVDGDSAAVVKRFGPVVASYMPLTSKTTGKPAAAFEVYHRYEPIAAEVRRTLLSMWSLIAVVSVLVYLGQLGIVRSAQRSLQESEDELVEANRRLEDSLRELESHTVGTLQALVTAVDAKDSYTASHSLGVADCALAIGRRMGLSAEELVLLEKAALLHDIGKIGVPERILLKSSELTHDERHLIAQHAELSGRMVESVPFLADVVPVVKHHHERWDGHGYPGRLSGERIPLLARILAVADAYDAMTSDRPYRSALAWFRVRQQLRRNSGAQFDPQVVSALLVALRAGEVTVEGHRAQSADSAS